MNIFQWVMIGVAAFLVAPVVWNGLISLLPKREDQRLPLSVLNKKPCQGLVDVVQKWDDLKKCCEHQNMTKAAEELQKIFPLFAQTNGGNKKL